MLDARGTDEGRSPRWRTSCPSTRVKARRSSSPTAVARHLLGIRLVCARAATTIRSTSGASKNYYGLADFVYRQKARGYGNGGEKDSVRPRRAEVRRRRPTSCCPTSAARRMREVKLAHGGSAAPNFLFGGSAGKERRPHEGPVHVHDEQGQHPAAARAGEPGLGLADGPRRGCIPVDDFNLKNKAMATALLEGMVRDTIENKYSVKRIIRAICNTEAYQRSCSSDTAGDEGQLLPRHGEAAQRRAAPELDQGRHAGQRPSARRPQTIEMVGSLYPAGAIWCEVTPLPGNARQALLLRNNTQIMSWINGPVLQKVKSGARHAPKRRSTWMFLSALSRVATDSEKKRYGRLHPPRTGGQRLGGCVLDPAQFDRIRDPALMWRVYCRIERIVQQRNNVGGEINKMAKCVENVRLDLIVGTSSSSALGAGANGGCSP